MKMEKIDMILGQIIKDFPYPTRTCPYCNKNLVVVNAVHWHEDRYQYKALYFCAYSKCPVYDEGAKKAYARIVYSSEDAAAYFWRVQIPVQRWEQADVVSIYE
jgi:hypothetical protein